MSLLKANLDQSLSTILEVQEGHYFLNADGSIASRLKTWIINLIHKIPYVQSYYDPIVTNIDYVFDQCVTDWVALKNEQSHGLRSVTPQEFTQQIKRVCFVVQFILAYRQRIESHQQVSEHITRQLAELLPGHPGLSVLQEMTPEVFSTQLDQMTGWKIEEETPPTLTEDILRIPPPLPEESDKEETDVDISELPDFYYKVVHRLENPNGGWFSRLKNWWGGRYQAEYQSLKAMCATVLEDKDVAKRELYAQTKRYLGKILTFFKKNRLPDLQVKTCLDELVYASHQCAGEWTTETERRYKILVGKEETPQEKFIQWKCQFIDQHLMKFFRTIYTKTEDAHNAHLMNTLLYHYGERLGRQDLQAPRADIHVIKKTTSLPYQWPDIYRYLDKAWKKYSVEAFKTYAQMKCWENAIKVFLTTRVAEKAPSMKDPEKFVTEEYFDLGILNNRGAIRFLREALK